ncbi:hypothetical protein [Brevibacterium samyangense]|uniref:Lipoprotein n=1 Tax=Brevibacterium samyangense TaxID=366888 RepID=A0ABP5F0H9_9MICO
MSIRRRTGPGAAAPVALTPVALTSLVLLAACSGAPAVSVEQAALEFAAGYSSGGSEVQCRSLTLGQGNSSTMDDVRECLEKIGATARPTEGFEVVESRDLEEGRGIAISGGQWQVAAIYLVDEVEGWTPRAFTAAGHDAGTVLTELEDLVGSW